MGYLKLYEVQPLGQHSSAHGEHWLCWNTLSHAESCGLQEQGKFWNNNMKCGERRGDTSFTLRETTDTVRDYKNVYFPTCTDKSLKKQDEQHWNQLLSREVSCYQI